MFALCGSREWARTIGAMRMPGPQTTWNCTAGNCSTTVGLPPGHPGVTHDASRFRVSRTFHFFILFT